MANIGEPEDLIVRKNVILTDVIIRLYKTCFFRRNSILVTVLISNKGRILDPEEAAETDKKLLTKIRILDSGSSNVDKFFKELGKNIPEKGNFITKKDFNNLVVTIGEKIPLTKREWTTVDPALDIAEKTLRAKCGFGMGKLLEGTDDIKAGITRAKKLGI